MSEQPHYTAITEQSTIRDLFRAAVAECSPPAGVSFESHCLVDGTLFKHRLVVSVIALPSAGSDPHAKH